LVNHYSSIIPYEELHPFPTTTCQPFGIILPAAATIIFQEVDSPFNMADVKIAARGPKRKKITWARWHPPEILKSGGKPVLTELFLHIHELLE